MTTPPSSSGHWPELEGQIPPRQPDSPPQARPQPVYAAKLQDFGNRVGSGARFFGEQAKARFAETRDRIDTPENRARFTQSGPAGQGVAADPAGADDRVRGHCGAHLPSGLVPVVRDDDNPSRLPGHGFLGRIRG